MEEHSRFDHSTHLDVVVVVAQVPQGEVREERDVDGGHGGQECWLFDRLGGLNDLPGSSASAS